MATAHELARKLLAGPDYEVVLAHGPGRPTMASRVRSVESLSGKREGELTTDAVVVLTPEPPKYIVDCYGR